MSNYITEDQLPWIKEFLKQLDEIINIGLEGPKKLLNQ